MTLFAAAAAAAAAAAQAADVHPPMAARRYVTVCALVNGGSELRHTRALHAPTHTGPFMWIHLGRGGEDNERGERQHR